MPYQPIALGPHAPKDVQGAIRNVVDEFLRELRFLLTVQDPGQGANPSYSAHGWDSSVSGAVNVEIE